MFRVHGLYGHIAKNNVISLGLIAGFVAAACALWVVAAMWGLLFGTLIAFLLGIVIRSSAPLNHMMALMQRPEAFISTFEVPLIASALTVGVGLLFLRRIIQHLTGAAGVARRDEPRLYTLVENLSLAAGLPMPRIEIIEQGGMNAYATGLSPRFATIAVTRGLLKGLTDRELEAVLAHEIAHIKNRDTRVMAIAALFGSLISKVSDTVWVVFLRRPLSLNDTFQVTSDAAGGRATANVQSQRLIKLFKFIIVFFGLPVVFAAALAAMGHHPSHAPWVNAVAIALWMAASIWTALGDQIKALLRGEISLNRNIVLAGAALVIFMAKGFVPYLAGTSVAGVAAAVQGDGEPAGGPALLVQALDLVLTLAWIGIAVLLVLRALRRAIAALNPFKRTPTRAQHTTQQDRQASLLPSLGNIFFAPLWLLNLLSGAAVTAIFAGTTCIRGAITRAREYMADAGAVELIKDVNPLISALRKIDRHDRVADVPTAFLATMISGPSIGWLATHPTVAQRITALRAFGEADAPVRPTQHPTPPIAPRPASNSRPAPRRPRIEQGMRGPAPVMKGA